MEELATWLSRVHDGTLGRDLTRLCLVQARHHAFCRGAPAIRSLQTSQVPLSENWRLMHCPAFHKSSPSFGWHLPTPIMTIRLRPRRSRMPPADPSRSPSKSSQKTSAIRQPKAFAGVSGRGRRFTGQTCSALCCFFFGFVRLSIGIFHDFDFDFELQASSFQFKAKACLNSKCHTSGRKSFTTVTRT